jgi:hypothetical protein
MESPGRNDGVSVSTTDSFCFPSLLLFHPYFF